MFDYYKKSNNMNYFNVYILFFLSVFVFASSNAQQAILSNTISVDANTISNTSNSLSSSQSLYYSQQQSLVVPFWSDDFSVGFHSSWTNSPVPWAYRGPSTSPNQLLEVEVHMLELLCLFNHLLASNGFVIFDSDYYDNGGVRWSFWKWFVSC